jgi:hypothetical protein
LSVGGNKKSTHSLAGLTTHVGIILKLILEACTASSSERFVKAVMNFLSYMKTQLLDQPRAR